MPRLFEKPLTCMVPFGEWYATAHYTATEREDGDVVIQVQRVTLLPSGTEVTAQITEARMARIEADAYKAHTLHRLKGAA